MQVSNLDSVCLCVCLSDFRYTSFAIVLFFGTVYYHHVTLSLRTSVYSRIALTLQTFRYLCTFVSPLWSCHADVTNFRPSRLSRYRYTVSVSSYFLTPYFNIVSRLLYTLPLNLLSSVRRVCHADVTQ